MFCYTNNIPQRDGGTHLARLPQRADAHAADTYIEKEVPAKDKLGDDAATTPAKALTADPFR